MGLIHVSCLRFFSFEWMMMAASIYPLSSLLPLVCSLPCLCIGLKLLLQLLEIFPSANFMLEAVLLLCSWVCHCSSFFWLLLIFVFGSASAWAIIARLSRNVRRSSWAGCLANERDSALQVSILEHCHTISIMEFFGIIVTDLNFALL
jgi:hypothetical protein